MKGFALGRPLTGTLLAVAKLKASHEHASEENRVQAFVAAQHGCRATYYNLAKKLPSRLAAAALLEITEVPDLAAAVRADAADPTRGGC